MSYRGPRIRATKSAYQYPYMQYPYQNVGTQLTWRNAPPYRSRGADAASLGSMDLPLPGAPEVISAESGYAGYESLSGCGGGCGKPCCGPAAPASMGDIVPGVPNALLGVGIGLGAYFLFLRKKRR